MPAVGDSGEGLVVFTTPANPFMPQGMKPGETRSYSQKVSVNYIDDPSGGRAALLIERRRRIIVGWTLAIAATLERVMVTIAPSHILYVTGAVIT
jgi:hypothetical protein